MSILGIMTCSAMDIWAVLYYYILSKSCLPGGKVIMFATKRRETSHRKLSESQEHENYSVQSSKPKKYTKTSSDETQIVEHCNFKEEFEFSLADIKDWASFLKFMYRPMDPASLGLIRIMFGMYNTILLVIIHY
jgi:hypothetical protein